MPNKAYTESELVRLFRMVGEPTESGCWPWLGYFDQDNYPLFRRQNGKSCRAQRLMYETFRMPIPKGLVTDHLCRNRRCVNPFHIEPVTNGENVRRGVSPSAENRRKATCQAGHDLSGDNLRVYKGQRICRACARVYHLARYYRLGLNEKRRNRAKR